MASVVDDLFGVLDQVKRLKDQDGGSNGTTWGDQGKRRNANRGVEKSLRSQSEPWRREYHFPQIHGRDNAYPHCDLCR